MADIMAHFATEHLSPHAQAAAAPFVAQAHTLMAEPDTDERTAQLKALLAQKDAAVRAALKRGPNA